MLKKRVYLLIVIFAIVAVTGCEKRPTTPDIGLSVSVDEEVSIPSDKDNIDKDNTDKDNTIKDNTEDATPDGGQVDALLQELEGEYISSQKFNEDQKFGNTSYQYKAVIAKDSNGEYIFSLYKGNNLYDNAKRDAGKDNGNKKALTSWQTYYATLNGDGSILLEIPAGVVYDSPEKGWITHTINVKLNKVK